MAPRRVDIHREAQGTKFVYGVDANVVARWGNPVQGSDRNPSVGRIFSHDPGDLATAIGLGLLSHVFNYLGDSNLPLLIIPPIEKEIAGMLHALQQVDHHTASPQVAKQVDAMVARFQQELTPERLGSLNVKLHEIVFNAIGEDLELRRIMLLFAQRRLIKLEDAEAPLMRLPSSVQLCFRRRMSSTGFMIMAGANRGTGTTPAGKSA